MTFLQSDAHSSSGVTDSGAEATDLTSESTLMLQDCVQDVRMFYCNMAQIKMDMVFPQIPVPFLLQRFVRAVVRKRDGRHLSSEKLVLVAQHMGIAILALEIRRLQGIL